MLDLKRRSQAHLKLVCGCRLRPLQQAEITLLVIDGRAGLLPEDLYFAQQIRRSGTSVLLLANKCEGNAGIETTAEAWQLGLGAAVPISAAHGDGLSDLYDALLEQARLMGLESALFDEEQTDLLNKEDVQSRPVDIDNEPDMWIDEAACEPIRIAVGRPTWANQHRIRLL